MTIKIYQTDSYVKEFETKVMGYDADNHAVILDQTAFYPGGGGQPGDLGTLEYGGATFSLKKVKQVSGKILHFLPEDAQIPEEGALVYGAIDWNRRYQLMRTHTALHILCGVVFRDYGAQVTGGNMDRLKGRLDFEFETLRQELIAEIEEKLNIEMNKAIPIEVKILPRKEAFEIPDLIRTKINLLPAGITEVRTVELVGLDMQADGGTHVKNTSEVGPIRVANYKSKGKINKRIYIEIEE